MHTFRGLTILATVLALVLPDRAMASVREKVRKGLPPLVANILKTAEQALQPNIVLGEFTNPTQERTICVVQDLISIRYGR